MSVVVVGSINRDVICRVDTLPRPGETVPAHGSRELSGGKGANQAVAAARTGAQVAMVGCIGADAAGLCQRDGLIAAGVDTGGLVTVPDLPTGTAYIAIDRAGENQIIVDPGANTRLGPAMIDARRMRNARVVLTQLETPIAAALHAFTLADGGAIRMLNTAPALPAGASLFAPADVIVLNQSELAHYLGMADDPASIEDALAARRLLTRDGQSAIVTLGARGAVLVEQHTHHFAPAFHVEAIDTTGAGDCFCGVLAALLAEGMPMPRAVEAANAAAALCVQSEGAAPAMPLRAAVEALTARVGTARDGTAGDGIAADGPSTV